MMTRPGPTGLHVIGVRNPGGDEFAPAEPAYRTRSTRRGGSRRRRAQELALEQLELSRDVDGGIER
jgi:hypothetical protein